MNIEPQTLSPKKNVNYGLIGVGLFGGLATGLMALTFPFVVPAFRRIVLPFVPATSCQIENVLEAVKYVRPNIKKKVASENRKSFSVIDLGSGDGRIVIECAKQGFRSHGVELNPWLVVYSKYRALSQNLYKLATFQCKDLFKVDLSKYEKIVIFGVDSLMPEIEKKVRVDCDQTGKQVTLIVCRFALPNWQPFHTIGEGVDQVWLYEYYPTSSYSIKQGAVV